MESYIFRFALVALSQTYNRADCGGLRLVILNQPAGGVKIGSSL
jgi:hypothetical protein